MTETPTPLKVRRTLWWWITELGDELGTFWGNVFSDNEAKLLAMSTFVGHMVNYTFIQIAFYFGVDSLGPSFEWGEFWVTVAVCLLFFFNTLYSVRLVGIIGGWFSQWFWPSLPSGIEGGFLGIVAWCARWGIFIAFIVALNFFNASVTSALSDIAKAQTPRIERTLPPPERPRELAPSCANDYCIA
jgi:hypothetical protein